jgi:hypothetical protein
MTDQNDPQKRIDRINDKLDEVASKASGPDVAYGATPGYADDVSEEELKKAAEAEGVTLRRRPDGSHEAIDESAATPPSDTASAVGALPRRAGSQTRQFGHSTEVRDPVRGHPRAGFRCAPGRIAKAMTTRRTVGGTMMLILKGRAYVLPRCLACAVLRHEDAVVGIPPDSPQLPLPALHPHRRRRRRRSSASSSVNAPPSSNRSALCSST